MGWIWPVDHNLPTPDLVSLEGGLALFVQVRNTRLSTGLAIPLAGIYPTDRFASVQNGLCTKLLISIVCNTKILAAT